MNKFNVIAKEVHEMRATTDVRFQDDVLNGNARVIVVDFWASWCGPCKIASLALEKIKDMYDESKVSIFKLDVDENPGTSTKYQVVAIPTVAFFKKGELVKQLVGVQTADTYVAALTALLQ